MKLKHAFRALYFVFTTAKQACVKSTEVVKMLGSTEAVTVCNVS